MLRTRRTARRPGDRRTLRTAPSRSTAEALQFVLFDHRLLGEGVAASTPALFQRFGLALLQGFGFGLASTCFDEWVEFDVQHEIG